MGGSSAARLEKVRKIMRVPYLTLHGVTPDGRVALLSSEESGTFQLTALTLATRRKKRLTKGRDAVLEACALSDSRTAVFSRDRGGSEQHRLYAVPIRGGAERRVADLPPMRVWGIAASNGGGRVAFAGATRTSIGVYVADAATGALSRVYEAPHDVVLPEWSGDDASLCVPGRTTEDPKATELIFLDADGKGTPRIYTPRAGSENLGVRWHPNEPRVLFRTDARGRYDLAVYDTAGGELRFLQAGELGLGFDFPGIRWSPDGNSVFYLAAREGRTRLYREPLDGSEPPVRLRLPEGYHGRGVWETGTSLAILPDGRSLVLAWSGIATPPTVSRYDVRRQRASTVFRLPLNVPLAKAEHVVYRSFDGLPIHGWFVKPPGRVRKRPCIVWVHGGPTSEVADQWTAPLQAFAAAGYCALAPNYRGSTGYGPEFMQMNIGDIGGGDLKDVAAGWEYLRTRPEVDPRRIAIGGVSYGGYMTYLALTKLPDLWAAGIAKVGITDWEAMYEMTDALNRSAIESVFGSLPEKAALYRDRSPIHFVENLRAPLLILHSSNDARCPLKPVEAFAERLKALGRRYEMRVYPNEGHPSANMKTTLEQYALMVRFLDREAGAAG